jgi:hypothetical protein
MLAHETWDCTKHSNQPLVFLKLDFSKTYHKVSWDCYFLIFKWLGMVKEFIIMVKILFKYAKGAICFNSDVTKTYLGLKEG